MMMKIITIILIMMIKVLLGITVVEPPMADFICGDPPNIDEYILSSIVWQFEKALYKWTTCM